MTRWGMVVDLRKCIGCQACTIVCKETNQVPRNHWRWVVDGGVSEYPDRQRMSLPMSCMHCSEPPCLEVCPTTATYRRPDGIVDINYELCVGCSYCIVACPYLARSITFHKEFNFKVKDTWQEPDRADPNLSRISVCTKCNFCMPRVDVGLAQGLQPGLDPEASPMCVSSCTAHALHFGDLNDPDSVVSQLIRENKTARLQEELGTEPSVSYIVGPYSSDGIESNTKKVELIQPKKQKVWGWPAVLNFILGGMATGFYLLSLLATILQDGMAGVSQPGSFKLLAPALAGLGFLALTLEAGRPLRSRHLLRHLNRSWMSRETLAGAIFIPVAVLDWLSPHPVLWSLAAVVAMGLMITQGFIIYRARAVTAWNMSLMPFLFLTSGFATGSGLMLLTVLEGMKPGRGPAVIGLICVALNLAVWLLYLRWSHDTAFQEAIEALRRPTSLVFTIGIGHLLPFLLLLFLAVPINIGIELQHIVAALAGLTVVIGGVSQKAGIVLEAGYLRGVTLGLPQNAQGVHRVSSVSSPATHSTRCSKTLQIDGVISE